MIVVRIVRGFGSSDQEVPGAAVHANERRGWTQADHAQPGDAVIVPDFYAGRMTLWIDEKLHLPVQADIYDHDGRLYEHYEHHDLKIDVPLTGADFDPKNPAYDF